MYLIYHVFKFSINHRLLNKQTNKYVNIRAHQKTIKSKYNNHLNKEKVSHIKLTYLITYNWLVELALVNKFDGWENFVGVNTDQKYFSASGRDMDELPKEIGQLINLEVLGLHHNNLEYLPKEIGKLTKMQKLLLYNNKIRYLPKQICKLTNLQYLDVDGNQLKYLPKGLEKFIDLRFLMFCFNKFRKFPKQICKVTNIQYLDMCGNKIKHLPYQLTNLINLKLLDITDNPIKNVPTFDHTITLYEKVTKNSCLNILEHTK